jgi:poly-beta-1,6-N-acetyl-D-glucosamine synthase
MDSNEQTRYVVITPVRDEEEYIEHTIKSMVSQTIKPAEWIIVDDGSTDRTGLIIDDYASHYAWIHPVHRDNRGYRKSGWGVMDAFYDGYHSLTCTDWSFLVKLDGDLGFDEHYFEKCFDHLISNPRYGIGGGILLNLIDQKLIVEKTPLFHVRGATKIYKRACWNAIGGLIKVAGWDTIDEVKANMLGWETMTFADIQIIHYRYTGQAEGRWTDAIKNGKANYICGYHPIYMLLKCLNRIGQKPFFIYAVGHMYGFVLGYISGLPQIDDKALIAYLRKQQLRRLLFMDSIWK